MPSPLARLRELEIATRPEHPDLARALATRWEELPARVKRPNQMLGQRMSGCEGTHGVFPSCDLACTPCYHGTDANRVRTDGDHTEAEVDAQMALLRRHRGPGQHAREGQGGLMRRTVLQPARFHPANRLPRPVGRARDDRNTTGESFEDDEAKAFS